MCENIRQEIELSKICCQCLKTIQDVSYANAYTVFSLKSSKLLQEGIRRISPEVQREGDWLRIGFEGMKVAFSISDKALELYKPIIMENICFGSAVRILGTYENYIRRIVELSYQHIPRRLDKFESDHKKLIRSIKSFWSEKLGRGIDFFQEVFDWNPRPKYRPGLQLMFHLRNLAVHNAGIADQKLCQLASNRYVDLVGTFNVGKRVPWNLGTNLQLQHLVIGVLSEVDPCIAYKLELPTFQKQPFWHVDTENSVR